MRTQKNPNLNYQTRPVATEGKIMEYRTFVAYEKINKVMQKSTKLITGL